MLNNALPYIHRFIEVMIKRNIELKSAVLYGSFADNTASPVSDIDLKIFIYDKNDEANILKIEDDINKQIQKDGFKFYIKSMILANEDTEHIEEGILLWGNPIKVSAEQKELSKMKIITYDTTKLAQIKRAELVRRLFGYKTKRKVKNNLKTYAFEGCVKQFGATRLKNGIVVDEKSAKIIEDIFRSYDLEFESTEIYLPEYAKFIEKG